MKISIFDAADLEEQNAIEMRERLLQLSENKKFCVLLDATNSFYVTPEARALIASKEFAEERIATAFVVSSLANKLVGNFFINFNKPHTPTKLFSNEETALVWLISEVKKENDRVGK